jgi:hypothetical protein
MLSIFTKYTQFLGGEQHLRKIRSRIDSGAYNYGGIEFSFVSYAQAPDHYKYIVTFKGKYFAQSFDGTDGWKIDVFKNEKNKTILHGKPAAAMANEADVIIRPHPACRAPRSPPCRTPEPSTTSAAP